ncbi:MAG: exopolysaccharide biosynthesis protein [Sphingomicrobium sp.]
MTPIKPDAGETRPPLLSQRLAQIIEEGHERLSFSDLAEQLGNRAWGALLFIFAIVNVIPLPPGTNIVLAIPMIIVAAQMLFGRESPWFPKWIDRRGVSRSEIGMVASKVAWLERRAERLLKPRLARLTGKTAARLIGLSCVLLGVLAAVPIPLLHMAPAAGIALFGLALIYRDGVLVVVAAAASLAAIAVDALILGSGVVVLNALTSWLNR